MIRREVVGDVLIVSLDRTDRRNALTPTMFDQLGQALDNTPSQVRAILLAGEGAAFCAGFDLRLCLDRPGTLESLLRSLSALIRRLRFDQPRPVVVAAHGAAIAGGCALLGAGDVVLSDDQAKIGYPVTPLGISPAVSAAFLRLCIPDGKARERLLDPALLSGREAARIGLVHECVTRPEDVRPRAMETARSLASKPPDAIAATRGWLAEIEQRWLGAAPTSAEQSLAASLSRVESREQQERLRRLFEPKIPQD
jgi:enoyl-CoA hydratase/carnithine racemase